mmetsp:Transcript_9588/g.11038  ORF Transcript_9588/g.11038 Transcript_9588/m.11038 type:complete len:233 (-) Transcript_9588:86-784(-)
MALNDYKLLYGLVAHSETILAEYSPTSGNFAHVTHQLLSKIDISKDSRMSYASGEYTFNYCVKDEITFLCLSRKDVKSSLSFAFLKKVSNDFVSMFGQKGKKSNVAYAFNSDFSPMLKKSMEYYNSEHFDLNSEEKLQNLKSELGDVKGVIEGNISQILDRGEQLDNLVFSTEKMADSSQAFRSSATRLRHRMWWNDVKVQAMGCALFCLLLFLLSAWFCGGITFSKCSLSD